jgi:hypothetical protein
MKKFTIAFLVLLALSICGAAHAQASGLYICIPTTPVTGIEVELAKTGVSPMVTSVTAKTVGSEWMVYDTTTLTPGVYTFRVRFYGAGGWVGDWSDPYLVGRPEKPTCLKVH